jgi:hypothetical protein
MGEPTPGHAPPILGGAKRHTAGASQFLDPSAGRLCEHSSRQRSLHQRVSKPNRLSWPEPKTGRSAGVDTKPPCRSPPPPHGPALACALAPPESPSALGAPLDSAPAWATVSRAELLSSRSKTGRPSFNPPPLHSVEGPASAPAQLPQRRQAAALHALPRPRMAPANVRSPWSAPACRRCRRALLRPETSHPTPAFHKRPDGLLTRRHCLFEGPAPPRPDGYDSMKGPVPPGPTDATKGVLPSDAVERVPPRPDGVGVIPSFGGLAVSSRVVGRAMLWRAGFHPGPGPGAAATHRTPCAAATPHGAFDFAKRLECPACWRF